MSNPWDLRSDASLTRHSDVRETFIIFCEDEVVEPAYFKRFSNTRVQVNPIPNQGQHHECVDNATTYCREEGLLVTVEGRQQLQLDEGAQVWCVFDRDKTAGDGKEAAFDNSIQNAEHIGFNVAWSNDDFELWVLLHFEDVPLDDADYQHRNKYYERLTECLRAVPAPTAELARLTAHPSFGYKHTMKTAKRFIPLVFPLMEGNLDAAIHRATALLDNFNSQISLPVHQWMPCTKVVTLVKAILDAGGDRY